MKSILVQQSAQRSPWAPTRLYRPAEQEIGERGEHAAHSLCRREDFVAPQGRLR